MTTIRVIDLETTGIDPKDHRIIEVAAVDLHDNGEIEFVGAHLVNPGRDIPPDASAVHHLIAADLVNAPQIGAIWATYFGVGHPTVLAAHNAEFESGYVPAPQGGHWICTYKASLRAWPDAPGHGNQVLRYWRGLDGMDGFDRSFASLAHRAGPDAYVTAWLLRELLKSATLADLITWTAEPKVYPRISFGKHRGAAWADVPTDYLQWLRDGQHQMEADWRHGAKIELARRGQK
jgi:exodeoxyribonuclease X